MKIRTGFVSNSSTSSFVICGYKIPEETPHQEIMQKLLGITENDIINKMKKEYHYKDKDINEEDIKDYCSEWLYDIRSGQNDIDILMGEGIDGIIIGIMISSGDPIEDNEISMTEIHKKLEKIENCFDVKDMPIKIFAGTEQH